MMTPERSGPAEAGRVVFVVDDDPALVESLADVLRDEGYGVEGFTQPRDALARLRGGAQPHALLLDYMMPEMSGEEFVAALSDAHIEVPVLLLSGLHAPAVKKGAVVAVVPKPFDLERLLAALEQAGARK